MRSERALAGNDLAVALHQSAPYRQARLLGHLRSQVFVDVQKLKDELGVSIATIRRDLTELEGRGLLKRTHGGAVVIDQVMRDSVTSVRESTNAVEKARIAEVAASIVVNGDAVMIDSGTTSLQVARRLAANPTLTFVTNGSDTLAALTAGGARNIHVIGGEYIDVNHSFGGSMAVAMVRGFNVDKAVLSVSSIDLARRLICTVNPQVGSVQQAMIEIAQSVLVVADHSKFARASLSVIAPLDRVDYIVTNTETRPKLGSLPRKIKRKFVFA